MMHRDATPAGPTQPRPRGLAGATVPGEILPGALLSRLQGAFGTLGGAARAHARDAALQKGMASFAIVIGRTAHG